jgi:hypothetical protein
MNTVLDAQTETPALSLIAEPSRLQRLALNQSAVHEIGLKREIGTGPNTPHLSSPLRAGGTARLALDSEPRALMQLLMLLLGKVMQQGPSRPKGGGQVGGGSPCSDLSVWLDLESAALVQRSETAGGLSPPARPSRTAP